jgi:hypothetical protein
MAEHVDVDLAFAHRFACEILDEYKGASPPDHYFPRDEPAGQDGLIVRVQPDSSKEWTGVFAFGRLGDRGISRVLSLPDPEKLCVVSKGAGYIVAATDPRACERLRTVPIVDVRTMPQAGVVIFANHTNLVAHGVHGVAWRTPRLALDGFKIVEVTHHTVVGEYWDLRSEAMETFEVDARTGSTRGGVGD